MTPDFIDLSKFTGREQFAIIEALAQEPLLSEDEDKNLSKFKREESTTSSFYFCWI